MCIFKRCHEYCSRFSFLIKWTLWILESVGMNRKITNRLYFWPLQFSFSNKQWFESKFMSEPWYLKSNLQTRCGQWSPWISLRIRTAKPRPALSVQRRIQRDSRGSITLNPFDSKFHFRWKFWINVVNFGYHIYPICSHTLLLTLYLTLAMMNKLICHAHLKLSASQITWSSFWYKFTYLVTNSVEHDQLASEVANWSDLHCLQRHGISGFSRTRVKKQAHFTTC